MSITGILRSDPSLHMRANSIVASVANTTASTETPTREPIQQPTITATYTRPDRERIRSFLKSIFRDIILSRLIICLNPNWDSRCKITMIPVILQTDLFGVATVAKVAIAATVAWVTLC